MPVRELAARRWDAVVVGGGHNGLTAAAYVVGLLHPLVVDELDLRRHGFDVVLVDPSLWCPFPDGTSVAVYADAERTLKQVAALAPADVDGFRAYEALFERIRRALRTGPRDTWVGPSPDRP